MPKRKKAKWTSIFTVTHSQVSNALKTFWRCREDARAVILNRALHLVLFERSYSSFLKDDMYYLHNSHSPPNFLWILYEYFSVDSMRQCEESMTERNLTTAQNNPWNIFCEMENASTKLPDKRCARGRPALSIHSRFSLHRSAPLTGRAGAEKKGQRGGESWLENKNQPSVQ